MSRKIKYSLEFKISAVEKVLKQHLSVSQIAKEIGTCKSQLQLWLHYYKRYGKEGLKPKSNHYTSDFKLKVIKAKQKKSLSLKETCLIFNIPSDSTLLNWIRKYEAYGKEVLHKETRGKANL